jgi:Holliday junction resolvasome RuvABC endonuclease subunit
MGRITDGMSRLLSIDPSIGTIGVAILEGRKYVQSYTIRTKDSEPMVERLRQISFLFSKIDDEFDTVIIEYPDAFMREGEYGIKNVRAVMTLMMSVGAIIGALNDRYDVKLVSVDEWKGKEAKKFTQYAAKQECGKKLNNHEADAFMMGVRWHTTIKFIHKVRDFEDGERTKKGFRKKRKKSRRL